ncbi:MAG: hypothetical protein ACR2OZ_06170 [Verrucomicrobiales bacterium]
MKKAARLLAILLPFAAFGAESRFQAGAAVVDITPPTGVRINGGFWPSIATEVHDPLLVRALALDDGKTRLAFAVADNCLITRDIFDEAKKLIRENTGLPAACVMMSATHTHSAGAVADCYLTDAEPEYKKLLPAKLAAAVQQAFEKLQPALIGWGRVEVPQHVFCRRWIFKPGTMPENPFGHRTDKVKMNPAVGSKDLVEPAGITDPEVSFLSIRTTAEQPLAVLANYSLHYVGDVGPNHLSADYFGAFAIKLGEKLKAPAGFVAIMSNGTSADINNINFRGSDPRPWGNYQRINLVGDDVATAVAAALRKLHHRPWVELRHSQRELFLGVRKPDEKEIAAAKELAQGRPSGLFKNLREVYARETLLLDKFPNTISQIVQAFRIGDLAIGGISNEVFAETGLALKKSSPLKPFFTVSLANGWTGYLPPRGQHDLGGYETWRSRTSYLEPDAESKIRAALLEVLHELK